MLDTPNFALSNQQECYIGCFKVILEESERSRLVVNCDIKRRENAAIGIDGGIENCFKMGRKK